ncbi:MAG: hypothetical protein M1823_003581 [Watsoniomyces obsoletus]|nr:MAG: hypothetical protein M1823_003581 [Watsoniomyces obsoletus]
MSPADTESAPYNLLQQIEQTETRLHVFITEQQEKHGKRVGMKRKARPKVILIGHSVGAYILLEIIRRHHHRRRYKTDEVTSNDMDMDIIGGLLLFPTVTHIAQSPSGVKYSVLTTAFLRSKMGVTQAL